MKKAILLCAGRGSRLAPFTDDKPKPLIEVNGQAILHHTLALLKQHGISELVVVTGYQADKIEAALSEVADDFSISIIHNEQWDSANNCYSLYMAREHLGSQDVMLVEGDVYLAQGALQDLHVQDGFSKALVSPLTPAYDGTCVYLDAQQMITSFTTDALDSVQQKYKTVNLYAFTATFARDYRGYLEEMIDAGHLDNYYEDALKMMPQPQLKAAIIANTAWFEVDSSYDLDIANYIFSNAQHTLAKSMHGGYWRMPMQDHALIYNFHFPPKKLLGQMQDNFHEIVLNYPGTSRIIERHLSYALGVQQEQLIIANGVSEMIKVLPQLIKGDFLLFEPSFNEYRNCLAPERVHVMQMTEATGFKIDVDAVIDTVQQQTFGALVLITPDNPSGQVLEPADIERIYAATEAAGTTIILDESFIDFSAEMSRLSFEQKMAQYPRMILFKSMSKTYGIGGLRLGYAVCANKGLWQQLKALLPIWNINGFAEEFLMRLPAYMKEYRQSCQQVRQETDALYQDLAAIDALEVLPSHANFMFCKIKDKRITADAFADKLLTEHGIYVKECSGKQLADAAYYLRISSRTSEENKRLVEKMRAVFDTIQ